MFHATDIDVLVLGNCLLHKSRQPPQNRPAIERHLAQFQLELTMPYGSDRFSSILSKAPTNSASGLSDLVLFWRCFSFARLGLAHPPHDWLAHNWHCVLVLTLIQTQLLRYPFIGCRILHFRSVSAISYIMTGVIYFLRLDPDCSDFRACNRDSLTCEAKAASPTWETTTGTPAYSPLFPSILAHMLHSKDPIKHRQSFRHQVDGPHIRNLRVASLEPKVVAIAEF